MRKIWECAFKIYWGKINKRNTSKRNQIHFHNDVTFGSRRNIYLKYILYNLYIYKYRLGIRTLVKRNVSVEVCNVLSIVGVWYIIHKYKVCFRKDAKYHIQLWDYIL